MTYCVGLVVYHGLDDMPGRSGIRGGTAGCEFVPAGRLQHINIKPLITNKHSHSIHNQFSIPTTI